MAKPPNAAADRRSPLVFDVSRLGRRPGALQEVHQQVPSPARIGLDLIAMEAGSPLQLDLRFESVSEGVLVSGTVSGPTSGQCSRCLEPVSGHLAIALTELFAYPDSLTESTTERDEIGHVVDHSVDLEQPIVDAVGLALPFAPLCVQDCPGLCPVCGVALAGAGPGHGHERIDPRWAKLAELLPPDGEPS